MLTIIILRTFVFTPRLFYYEIDSKKCINKKVETKT